MEVEVIFKHIINGGGDRLSSGGGSEYGGCGVRERGIKWRNGEERHRCGGGGYGKSDKIKVALGFTRMVAEGVVMVQREEGKIGLLGCVCLYIEIQRMEYGGGLKADCCSIFTALGNDHILRFARFLRSCGARILSVIPGTHDDEAGPSRIDLP
ncbi:hypothetical protein RJ640_012056 [Escallonia rubra]|uniref:Uncharacterized protein n=1 Tax=Escallonia rubra TaxID=112253 RepID=A0AA88RV69_9ASTE|nr:hypothetical protein RJ640_012056 [Escallonia rubra]